MTSNHENSIKALIHSSLESSKIELKDIASLELVKLKGDASSRTYWRASNGDESFIVCLDKPTSGTDRNKFVMTQGFFHQLRVRVPLIHDYKRNQGYILEEDLGDETLNSLIKKSNIDEIVAKYKEAIKLIIELQTIDVNSEYASSIFNESFDYERLEFETNFTIENMAVFVELESDIVNGMKDFFHQINSRVSKMNKVLTHRDFHSRNLMCYQDEVVMIDFQDARKGAPQYDLCSLLEDPYVDQEINQVKEDLKKFYFNQAVEEGVVTSSYNVFSSDYNDVALQRLFKAMGSYMFFANKGNKSYLEYLKPTINNIQRILKNENEYINSAFEKILSVGF